MNVTPEKLPSGCGDWTKSPAQPSTATGKATPASIEEEWPNASGW